MTNAYAAQSVCSPTRAALLTGKSPARLHLTTFLPGRGDTRSQLLLHPNINLQLPLNETTLAEHLKQAGYATACVGKWHLGGKGFLPTDQGFDHYHAGKANTTPSPTEGGKGEYDLTAKAIDFITAHRDRPFFLYLCHNSPHIAYSARAELIAKHQRAFEPVYAAVIETLDDTVGRLLAHLDRLKLAHNTIVIFTSDNGGLHVPEGPHQKITHNTPFRAGKGYLYEGGIRVPLLIRWPQRIAAQRTLATPMVSTDWLPTLLELIGREAPPGLDGVSLADELLGRGRTAPRPLYWHQPHYTNQGGRPGGAVRAGDWKLIEHFEDGRQELFNLVQDPGETNNCAETERDRVTALAGMLAAWRTAVGAQMNHPNPEADPAAHRRCYLDIDMSRFAPDRATPDEYRRALNWRAAMNEATRR